MGQFACDQNIKNMSCLNWGPAGKKVHICDLLPTSVSTRVQIVQTLCEGRELTFILLQSLMSWVDKTDANLLLRLCREQQRPNLRLLAEDRCVPKSL